LRRGRKGFGELVFENAIKIGQAIFQAEHSWRLRSFQEDRMALTAEQLVADVAAIRAAVRQLLEVAKNGSIGGEFAKNALAKGLAELNDVSMWGAPEGLKDALRTDSQRRYRDLFSGL
jgi:hypothetical protein